MVPRSKSLALLAVPLWMCFGRVAALDEPEICYVLDGILFLYGLVLTILYCRLKIVSARKEMAARKPKPKAKGKAASESIYTDLNPRPVDTYEVIGLKK
ncbi:high affinity immunoglobulin epsilon receptor subunit gamma [Synchiropus splendidus]|uniref:high affinity immunoglobulin epsilon receptor subunit gamma n=1 Tax=Synchiropus splendidus TaxID=270530 RepID=UPI00237DEEF3|nr:high affinity immunoglobulin epsilon receptor subunit gamma [Synchiropus splendidus]